MHATKQQRARVLPLLKRADFLRVQSHERKWVAKGFVLQIAPAAPCPSDSASGQKSPDHLMPLENSYSDNPDKNTVRCGFTVTKRTDKSAVHRNRMKRRLRAVAADVLSFHAKGGYDYVLIGRRDAMDLPYAVLCKDLRWCLRKMDLYQERKDGSDNSG